MTDHISNGIGDRIANGIRHGIAQGVTHATGDAMFILRQLYLPPTPLFPCSLGHLSRVGHLSIHAQLGGRREWMAADAAATRSDCR